MVSTIRNILRLLQILGILARHGVLPMGEGLPLFKGLFWLAGLSPAVRRHRINTSRQVRLRLALEELGPTFIKFGQALSTRVDALPDDVSQELKKLQDDVPPFPFAKVQEMVEESLGAPLTQLFASFDPVPVASASIAQVHHAFTRDGVEVAVKVKRPNIRTLVESDIRMLTALAELIEEHFPDWNRFRVRRVVEEFASTIREEMNFEVEAIRAQQFHRNFAKDPTVHVPQVIRALSSRRVLTLEWMEGIPIDELSEHPDLARQAQTIATHVVTSFFKQVFRDGYFHADQHPGNIFVRRDGTIALLDFGIVAQVSLQTRIWLAELLHGFLTRDYRKVARVHLDAGYITPETDMIEFEEACRQVGEPIFGQPLRQISVARLLSQLFKVTEQFQMVVQPQLLMLQKTIFTLEGVGRQIDPDLNVWVLAEPLIQEWMADNLGPRGKVRSARRRMEDLVHATIKMPELIYEGLDRLTHDRVQLRLHPASLERLERRVVLGFRRQSQAIAGGALFIGSSLLAVSGVSPWWFVPPLFLGIVNVLRSTRGVLSGRN